jgi:hypothetical protein
MEFDFLWFREIGLDLSFKRISLSVLNKLLGTDFERSRKRGEVLQQQALESDYSC